MLELTELEGNLLEGKKLMINASGLVHDSLRNAKDGWTNFGFKSKRTHVPNTSNNDYLLNLDTTVNVDTIFKVYFDRVQKQYYLNCENTGSDLVIVFVKLEKPFVIQANLENIQKAYNFTGGDSSECRGRRESIA